MSHYQVLARKYRPKNFTQLIGQDHVSHALASAIDTGRLHHAYLFTGTRGVGKTTIARILAKCLNCETGTTSTPCGVCDVCTSIDEGRFIDLIEIDAASRTKVEDTRDILENVPYAPTQGRFKVYLIDEVHMLSTHSFNALLKTLEEPPEHTKFILATTDPQKLPVTIISRCLQFVLRPLSQALLYQHLSQILQQEQISFSQNSLWQLSQSAKGSVRDALSLTDQAIAFGGGRLDDTTVSDMLGLTDTLDILSLIADIYQDNRPQVATHIMRLRQQMVDAVAILDSLVDSLHQLALVQVLGDIPLDMNDAQKHAFISLAEHIPADVLQLYYEIAVKSRETVKLASTPMQALEMGILRLLSFRPLAMGQMAISENLENLNKQSNDNSNLQIIDQEKLTKEIIAENQENLIQHLTTPSENLESESENLESESENLESESENLESESENLESESENLESESENLESESENLESESENLESESENLESESENLESESENLESESENLESESENLESESENLESESENLESESENLESESENLESESENLESESENLESESENLESESENLESESENLESESENLESESENLESESENLESESENLESESENLESESENLESESENLESESLAVNNSHLSNRSQLQQKLLAPKCELTGQWTAEKWDYWVSQARQNGWLDADELALASSAMMTGEIDGVCQLVVADFNHQTDMSFMGLYHKFSRLFVHAQLNSEMELFEQMSTDEQTLPINRQQQRKQAVYMDAQNNIINSPVMQTLWHSGYICQDKPAIRSFKLMLE